MSITVSERHKSSFQARVERSKKSFQARQKAFDEGIKEASKSGKVIISSVSGNKLHPDAALADFKDKNGRDVWLIDKPSIYQLCESFYYRIIVTKLKTPSGEHYIEVTIYDDYTE